MPTRRDRSGTRRPCRGARRDVLDAVARYRTVGTPRAVHRALRRAAGHPGHLVRYAERVLLTNTPDADNRWEIWSRHVTLKPGGAPSWGPAQVMATRLDFTTAA